MTSKQENLGALTFGLDIGIASVGWAVLGENRIIDLGVRCFDKAETAKEGESLNLARRTARLLRRRLRRRAWRLTKLARLLKREGVIADANLFKLKIEKNAPVPKSAWQLRVDALDRPLNAEEWARVIYHLCKHRGFYWISRAEEKAAEDDSKGESGKVKTSLAETNKLMAEKGYRTAAEMVMTEFFKQRTDANGKPVLTKNTGEPILDGVARNKQGDYSKALSRILLGDELKALFEHQRNLGNTFATEKLEAAILGNGDRKSGLFWTQNPALAGNKLLEMLGRCTFEKTGGEDGKGEYRAPKASFSAERQVWLTRLNNLRIVVDGTPRPLDEQERRIALPLPYQSGEKFTYKNLRTALVKAGCLPESFRFAMPYPSEQQKIDGKAKDPEADTLIKLPAWHELRLTLKKAELETEWQSMANAALNGKPELLDDIAWVLSVYKDDAEVETKLRKLALPNLEKMVKALLDIRFSKFHALSLKALRKIVPLMEQGQRHDEAVANIPEYGHHSQLRKVDEGKEEYLPPFYEDHRGKETWNKDKMLFSARIESEVQGGIPRNPVVLRALNQARKVMNALIREYGSPHEVHIEMARDLSRPLDERNKIKKEQDEYRDRNENDKTQFIEQFGSKPKDKEFEKFRLYREQQGKNIYPTMREDQGICAYSFEPIDLNRLLEPGYVEIDHPLPYQRSFDDSKNNRVLVLARENQNKRNMTPYEYLDGAENSERWLQFVRFVESNKTYRLAKRSRLLRKDFGDKEAEGFRERNLNDTRYICKFFKNYVEQYLQLHKDSTAKRCVVVSGSLTSLLRASWGLPTSKEKRAESDRHHAMDAVVIAACGHQVVKRLSTLVSTDGWTHKPELGGYVNVETGEMLTTKEFVRKDEVYKLFPRPWPHFRDELLARLKIDDPALLRTEMERIGTYPPEALAALRPLFVSRAPQRRNSGAAHLDTIYTKPRDGHVLMVEDKKAKKIAKDNTEKVLRPATTEEKASMAIARIGVTDKDSKGNYKLTLEKLEDIIDPRRNERMIEALRHWIVSRDEREKAAKAIEANFGRGKEKRKPTDAENAELERLRALPRKPLQADPDCGPFTGPIIRAVKVNAGKTTGISVRNGIAANDTMLRVDVFTKANKFHLVPVYVHHSVAKMLPNKAVVSKKDESQWTVMDDSYAFHLSLYPNDLLQLKIDGESILGYFAGININDGGLKYFPHDQRGADSLKKRGISGAELFTKFNVDILGNRYPAPPEKRRDLA
ncbi:MAG: type II CRISPR RNA-guided endonuclease Cas9 [Gallionellales bacterium RIFCSPHIGHO2_02_FULL_57_16]|nr:MAG: type II CRISPR RNA-guided endonuclease Cas9 [Gallionellales bacterium RIFCSPHIGHO2_02_FULL_57_16]